mgnify:CR=1 FL=1
MTDMIGLTSTPKMSEVAGVDGQCQPKSYIFVTHEYPDTDAWVCLWILRTFVAKDFDKVEIVFVRAGEVLPPEGESDGTSIIHADTGKGEYDQHGKPYTRTSSAAILAEKLGIAEEPGVKEFVELATATDNVERVSPTSIHYFFKGLPYQKRGEDKQIDWTAIQERVFEVLDTLDSWRSRCEENKRQFKEGGGKLLRLANGLTLGLLAFKPHLRQAAYDSGADVVLWTQAKGKKGFWVGVQVNSDTRLSLRIVAAVIRAAELRARGFDVPPIDELTYVGQKEPISGWFLHDSERFIACGSRSHPLEDHEFTKLSIDHLVEILTVQLGCMQGVKPFLGK